VRGALTGGPAVSLALAETAEPVSGQLCAGARLVADDAPGGSVIMSAAPESGPDEDELGPGLLSQAEFDQQKARILSS
jgi:hypothetical protein